jgi:hypothetical protein
MSIQIDNTNAGTLTLKPAASGSYTLTFPSAVAAVNGYVLSSDTSGTLSWAAGGGAEADTLATVTGRGATTATAVSITNATASTAVGTGALLVSGGASIGGRLSIQNDLASAAYGGSQSNVWNIYTYGDGSPGKSIVIGAGSSYDNFSGGALTLRSGDADETAGNVNITAGNGTSLSAAAIGGSIVLQAGTGQGSAGRVQVTRTTASTSTATGALTVAGGVGIAGAVYAGNIFSNGAEINTKRQTFIISMIFGGI